MSKPWSKLQRDIYKLIDDRINLQIQCRAYRMPESISTNPQIPRYWVTLGKEIIFDVPKNAETGGYDPNQLYIFIPLISQLIRDYINSPLDGLVEKKFDEDTFGFTDILKAADRRIGKRQWDKLPRTEAVQKIIAARESVDVR